MKTLTHSLKKAGMLPVSLAAGLRSKRNAVALKEPEDAALTGMTRSLDRRLLALNLRPMAKWPTLAVKAA